MKRFIASTVTALSLILMPLIADAQGQPAGTQITGRHQARGTVSNVDVKNEEVTVKTDDGKEVTLWVEPETAQKLKKGDLIEMDLRLTITRPSAPQK